MIDTATAKVTGYVNSTLEQSRRDATYPVPAFRLTVDGNDLAQPVSYTHLTLPTNREV